MTDLPVREMVLYKHGVGFFVRQGAVRGESVALAFRQDEINDVLKSLAVFDQSGGQVLGIHYQTPMDKSARLANSSINLSHQYSLRDLLRDLRGRRVSLSVEVTPGSSETVTGRAIGIDESYQDSEVTNVNFTFLADDGQVRIFPFSALRAISILDEQSEHDLRYFLDTSMSEDTRRTVTLQLSEGNHDLVVYYVAPSPTWRVSYRLVAESDENGETGKALLQGWGLFDNRLEEDLENVRVTLVAGQPISFIYELYASRIPVRPTVQDESRIAPGPVEYAGAALALKPLDEAAFGALADGVDSAYAPSHLQGRLYEKPIEELALSPRVFNSLKRTGITTIGDVLDMLNRGPNAMLALRDFSERNFDELTQKLREQGYLPSAAAPIPMRREQVSTSVSPDAQTSELGEFFQYEVTTPVSVKRGESALVPIIGSEISYQRELLYNGAKLPNHLVAAFRLGNTTGLTLERGPVTVVEDGDYKGEAVIPFTKGGNQVYVPYAVELGVRVVERFNYKVETVGLNIKDRFLVFDQYEVEDITYVIENSTARTLIITVEAPIRTDFELYNMPPADVETVSERRWKVTVPVRAKTEFQRKERHRIERSEELRRLDYKQLQHFMENRWLDRSTLDALSEMLDNMGSIQRWQGQLSELHKERTAIYQQQEQIRANLAALQPTEQEAALRNRVLAQLEAAQNRLEDIARQHAELTQQITESDRRVNEIIEGLG